jgi:hypothetical protein
MKSKRSRLCLCIVEDNGGSLDPSKLEVISGGKYDETNEPYIWNFLVRNGLLSTPDKMTREREWSNTVFPSLVELTAKGEAAICEFRKEQLQDIKRREYREKIEALVEELNKKFPEAGLSFGYLGNYERWGDDTSWYIFSEIKYSEGRLKWGGYPGRRSDCMEKMYNWARMELETRLTNLCGGE